MVGRDSWADQLRAFPIAWKLLAAAIAILYAAVETGSGVRAWTDEQATEAEVAAAVRPLREAVDANSKEDDKIHRQLRDQNVLILRYLVSIQAADLEPDRRRAAAAGALARQVYTDAILNHHEPETAAEMALKACPGWRRCP